jgi:hypothetical protein
VRNAGFKSEIGIIKVTKAPPGCGWGISNHIICESAKSVGLDFKSPGHCGAATAARAAPAAAAGDSDTGKLTILP